MLAVLCECVYVLWLQCNSPTLCSLSGLVRAMAPIISDPG